jgi:peptide/nickel transport system permease protein
MQRFILRRFLESIIVLIGTATVIFFLVRITGDPVTLMLPPNATAADVQQLRRVLGLDAPLYVQYLRFTTDLFRGHLGVSIRFTESCAKLILERLPATLELAGAALLFAMAIAFPVGIWSAVKPGSWVDNLGSIFTLLGQSTPVFWLGIMFIYEFSVKRQWLPSFGRQPGDIRYLVMPAVALGMYSAALTTRMLRSTLLSVLKEDYVRTARAKGLTGRVVLLKHVLRNALIPVITVIGLQMAGLLAGSVVTETVFAWPGVGRLVINAVFARDFPLVQACIIVISFFFVFVNLIVDILYALIDPRIRYQ